MPTLRCVDHIEPREGGRFDDRFRAASIDDLIAAFNRAVGSRAWTRARGTTLWPCAPHCCPAGMIAPASFPMTRCRSMHRSRGADRRSRHARAGRHANKSAQSHRHAHPPPPFVLPIGTVLFSTHNGAATTQHTTVHQSVERTSAQARAGATYVLADGRSGIRSLGISGRHRPRNQLSASDRSEPHDIPRRHHLRNTRKSKRTLASIRGGRPYPEAA